MKREIVLLAGLAAAGGLAQEATRQLWNTEFLDKRPAPKAASKAKPVSYRPVAQSVKPANNPAPGSGSMLGITLWRLRPAKAADAPGTRLLVLAKSGAKEETIPERVEANTTFSAGDEVRLTVEVPRTGYLYVIDREEYGAKTGPPYLIYPNFQTRQGDNVVAPGRLIEIPDQRDDPNCFTITPSQPGQTGEVLSILVTPEPLPGLQIGDKPLLLEGALFAEWDKKWGSQAERFELNDGAGQAWTETEKKAGADGSTRLSRTDAPPQTLYRIEGKGNSGVLLHVSLKMKQ